MDNKLNRIISIIRKLNEEAMVSGPTNASNSSSLGFDPETETPPVRKKKKYIFQIGLRRRWGKG
jgi:hypothetical protein